MAVTTLSIRSKDFLALQKAMRTADKDLYNLFRRELRRTLAYARDDIRDDWQPVEEALEAHWTNPPSPPIARGARNIESRVGPRSASVRAVSSSNMRLLNAGLIRHPGPAAARYDGPSAQGQPSGGRHAWYTTAAPSAARGWWDQAVAKVVPQVVEQAQLSITHFADELARKINAG